MKFHDKLMEEKLGCFIRANELFIRQRFVEELDREKYMSALDTLNEARDDFIKYVEREIKFKMLVVGISAILGMAAGQLLVKCF